MDSSHRISEISIYFHYVILVALHKFAKSESTDPIRIEFSYDRLRGTLSQILGQADGVMMRMNAGANLHTIELVKEIKDCLGKLEIQRQIDTQREPSSVGHRLPRSVSEG
jgi:hypothetical protein